jgi:hypothetical protein
MTPVCTDILLTDWRMTGDVVIGRAGGRREYACSIIFSLSKKNMGFSSHISTSFLFHFTPLPISTPIHPTLSDVPRYG